MEETEIYKLHDLECAGENGENVIHLNIDAYKSLQVEGLFFKQGIIDKVKIKKIKSDRHNDFLAINAYLGNIQVASTYIDNIAVIKTGGEIKIKEMQPYHEEAIKRGV